MHFSYASWTWIDILVKSFPHFFYSRRIWWCWSPWNLIRLPQPRPGLNYPATFVSLADLPKQFGHFYGWCVWNLFWKNLMLMEAKISWLFTCLGYISYVRTCVYRGVPEGGRQAGLAFKPPEGVSAPYATKWVLACGKRSSRWVSVLVPPSFYTVSFIFLYFFFPRKVFSTLLVSHLILVQQVEYCKRKNALPVDL